MSNPSVWQLEYSIESRLKNLAFNSIILKEVKEERGGGREPSPHTHTHTCIQRWPEIVRNGQKWLDICYKLLVSSAVKLQSGWVRPVYWFREPGEGGDWCQLVKPLNWSIERHHPSNCRVRAHHARPPASSCHNRTRNVLPKDAITNRRLRRAAGGQHCAPTGGS